MNRRYSAPWAHFLPLLFLALALGGMVRGQLVITGNDSSAGRTPVPPTATATPAPPLGPIAFVPPLSVNDCVGLLEKLNAELAKAPARYDTKRIDDSVPRLLQSVYNYLKFRDELLSSLTGYEWVPLGRGKVDREGADRDEFVFNPPIPHISVLQFEAENGDVILSEVLVTDENGHAVSGFRQHPERPWRIMSGMPRREVYHLWRRTEIAKIELRYAPAKPGETSPRISIFGARTNRREYSKMAMHDIDEALKALERGDEADFKAKVQSAFRNVRNHRDTQGRR